MTLVAPFIGYDIHLGRYTLNVMFDGENETLVFDSLIEAETEQQRLLRKRNSGTLRIN